MPLFLTSGNYGRVRSTLPGQQTFIVATLKKWNLTKATTPVKVPNFESPVDADGNVWPLVLQGLSEGSVAMEGQFNVDPSGVDRTDNGTPQIRNGMFLLFDFIFIKPPSVESTINAINNALIANIGFTNVLCMIGNCKYGTDIENQAASFTCDAVVNGIAPTSSAFQ